MKIKEDTKSLLQKYILPISVSVMVAVLFSFAKMAVDDVSGMHVEQGDFLRYWNKSVSMYYTWSSRVLVNFVVFIFTDNNPIYWAIFNGVSMFVLIEALKILFTDQHDDNTSNILAVCMVMLFPYWHLSSAGWMATVTTYFSPVAFGLLSLVPIKKILKDEKITWWEFVLYLLCLIYGANNEQVMVVLLCCYLVAFVWNCMMKKSWNLYLTINMLVSVASAIFTVTCPGNAVRKVNEIKTWFPAFEQMNIIDKAELGYETVAQWLVFGNNLFFEAICLLLFILVWKKYSDSIIRWIAAIPVFITIAFGPAMPLIAGIYPQINSLGADIPYWGLVNSQNRGGLGPYFEFLVMTLCLVIVLINIFLLCKNLGQFVVALTLAGSGFLSRVAIGISPTIYASNIRTNTVMSFCITAVAVYIFSINTDLLERQTEEKRGINKKTIIRVAAVLASFSAMNFVYVIYNTFR